MLLWLDLETTGLDPVNDSILEVAWTYTDDKLRDSILGDLIPTAVIMISFAALNSLRENSYVLKMHEDSGLADELMRPINIELKLIENLIVSQIVTMIPDDEPIYLAGASVHFDLAFIRTWMPKLADRLSHRVYDTSTLKAFFGEFVEHGVVNAGQHRAKNDVEECLAVARFYRNEVISATGEADN